MSTGEKVIPMAVGGNVVIDVSVDSVTDSFDFGRSYKWSVFFTKDTAVGNPIIQVEGSNDGVSWNNPYADKTDDTLPLLVELDEVTNAVFDSIFPFSQFRIRTESNGATGSMSYTFCGHFE